jgi:hypothetical protein
MTQQSNAAWGMVPQPFAMSDAFQENARRFWGNEDKILDSMKNFSNGWLERRHVGTHAALEAVLCMCKAQSPIDFANAYQDWLRGAFQRSVADAFACQEQFITLAGALAAPSIGAGEAPPESEATPVARAKAA